MDEKDANNLGSVLEQVLPSAAERRRYAMLQAAAQIMGHGYGASAAVEKAEEALSLIESRTKEKQPA